MSNIKAEQTCSAWFTILSRATVVALSQGMFSQLGNPVKACHGALIFTKEKSHVTAESILSGLKSSGLPQQELNGKAQFILNITAFLLSSAVFIFLPVVLSDGHPQCLFHLPKQNIPRILYYRLYVDREFSRERKSNNYTGFGTKTHWKSSAAGSAFWSALSKTWQDKPLQRSLAEAEEDKSSLGLLPAGRREQLLQKGPLVAMGLWERGTCMDHHTALSVSYSPLMVKVVDSTSETLSYQPPKQEDFFCLKCFFLCNWWSIKHVVVSKHTKF